MANDAIVTQEQAAIEDVKRLANIVLSLRNDVFKKGLDYGAIPGTGEKPVLLLPGMEKLMRALHLRAEYVEKSRIEDFGAGLIYYRYECRLVDYDSGLCISTAIGSANSRESKWRWRDQKRTCPKCGKETINRSKYPPKNDPHAEPGWYCYAKAGGCGAEYAASDPAITGQATGRIENPDIFDQMNTIDKIAQKRALGSAIKGAANVSEFFTVDLEDFAPFETSRQADGNVIEGTFTEVIEGKPASEPSASIRGAGIPQVAVQPRQVEPSESIGAPNEYHAEALIVSMGKNAKQFALRLAGGVVIPVVEMATLSELHIGETSVVALERSTYPISWRVQADKDRNGNWEILSITAPVAEAV